MRPSTYKIPSASDVPADFRVALYDGANREDTIYRSKAVGEPPLMLAISVFAAIADAIHGLGPGKCRCRSTRRRRRKRSCVRSRVTRIEADVAMSGRPLERLMRAKTAASRARDAGRGARLGAARSGRRAWSCRARRRLHRNDRRRRAGMAAFAEAQALLARRDGPRRFDKALGPELGQCCGGRVRR